MSDIIADTSALIAFFIRTEEHHSASAFLKYSPSMSTSAR